MRDNIYKSPALSNVIWLVIASLIPAGLAGVIIFGISALWAILTAVAAALATEALIQVLAKRKVTLSDGSAFLTGLLLAYNLPPRVPFWIPVIGSFFAIAIAKQGFGGLGRNIFNPALAGRAFLLFLWPRYMAVFSAPLNYDGVTQATPLAVLKTGRALENTSYWDLFLGLRPGCIGEVCIAALLLGAAFLLIKGYISWHIPLSYIATVGTLTFIFAGRNFFNGDWLLHILSGGLILGAFFMATDYVTSPLTGKGKIIFGVCCGLLTAAFRLWGRYAEGVSYAILIMNAATPLINRYTIKRQPVSPTA